MKTRIGRISDLVKCSRGISALLLLLLFYGVSNAMTISGIPQWLRPAVERSLLAVWNEIPNDAYTDREATLSLVSERLFTGYRVRVKAGREEPAVFFVPDGATMQPEVKLTMPELRGECLTWFSNDISKMGDEVATIAGSVPQEALTWCDDILREEVRHIVSKHIPGWEFTMQIYIMPASTAINLSFRPTSQMVLSLKPEIYSRTLPVMLRTDLEARLIPELSMLIGVPVKWAERHRVDIERVIRASLEDRHAVENLKAEVSVKFQAGVTSGIEARVDSEDFMFQMWLSAYAFMEGRYPEAGIFFGYRPSWKVSPEFYVEELISLKDLDVLSRLGMRLNMSGNFWAGVEMQWPEGEYFLRFEYVPVKVRRVYGLLRWSPNLNEMEGVLGYRIDEHVSSEVYYNTLGDDKIGLRFTWHL